MLKFITSFLISQHFFFLIHTKLQVVLNPVRLFCDTVPVLGSRRPDYEIFNVYLRHVLKSSKPEKDAKLIRKKCEFWFYDYLRKILVSDCERTRWNNYGKKCESSCGSDFCNYRLKSTFLELHCFNLLFKSFFFFQMPFSFFYIFFWIPEKLDLMAMSLSCRPATDSLFHFVLSSCRDQKFISKHVSVIRKSSSVQMKKKVSGPVTTPRLHLNFSVSFSFLRLNLNETSDFEAVAKLLKVCQWVFAS